MHILPRLGGILWCAVVLAGLPVSGIGATAEAVLAWGDNVFGESRVPATAFRDVVAISCGRGHTVALRRNGSVIAWGDDLYQQTSVPLSANGDVVSIAAGFRHTLALKSDGSVVGWGWNVSGQATIPAAAQNQVMGVAAGAKHSLVLKADGSVFAWGSNSSGQTNVPETAKGGIRAVIAGANHSIALTAEGGVVAWGLNSDGQSDVPNSVRTSVQAIAAGAAHSLALKEDGSVVAWGDNRYGQSTVPEGAKNGVVAIAAGSEHSMALKADGTIVEWGHSVGQLPLPNGGAGGTTVIAAGWYHNAAIVVPSPPEITVEPVSQSVPRGSNGYFSVHARGYPLAYQWRKDGKEIFGATGRVLPLGKVRAQQAGSYDVVVSNSAGSVTSTNPAALIVPPAPSGSARIWTGKADASVPLPAQSDVIGITKGQLVLKADGSVFAWGSEAGILPDTLKSNVIDVVKEYYHSLVLMSDGSVISWGIKVPGISIDPGFVPDDLQGVVAVEAGEFRSIALKSDGAVVVWGRNAFGETNLPLAAKSGVAAISNGPRLVIALKRDGTVIYWGGVSRPGEAIAPDFQGEIVAIAAGGSEIFALTDTGTLTRWGDVTRDGLKVPNEAQSGVVAMVAESDYLAVLKADGKVYAWELDGNIAKPLSVPDPNASLAVTLSGGSVVTLARAEAPRIRQQPAGLTAVVGTSVHLEVKTEGYPANSKWQKDGMDLPGAVNSGYDIPFVLPSDAGAYSVVVSSYLGAVTSSPPAVLSVKPSHGTLVAWTDTSSDPIPVPTALRTGMIGVSAAQDFILALRGDASVVSWNPGGGYNPPVPPEAQTGVQAIGTAASFGVALKTNGAVIAWGGSNQYGESDVPESARSGVVAISVGSAHILALKGDGTVVAWGDNLWGQATVPANLPGKAVAIAAGGRFSAALLSNGTVRIWGNVADLKQRLQITSATGIRSIAAGLFHLLALDNNGRVLGAGESEYDYGQSRVPGSATHDVVRIVAGHFHSLAYTSDGSLIAWGLNTSDSRWYPGYGRSFIPAAARDSIVTTAAGHGFYVALIGFPEGLEAKQNGSGIEISWPADWTDFQLQSTTELTPPVQWSNHPAAPILLEDHFRVIHDTTNHAGWFRLHRP